VLSSLLRSVINKASSNSWLTAVGRWAKASDIHSQNCLHTLFFSFFLFSSFDETTTKLQPHAERLTETVLHLHLGYFVVYSLFCFVLFPLWWENDRITSETPSPGLKAEGLTPKLLRLKLYCIWTWEFSFFLILFLSLECLSSLLLISTLSLPVYFFGTV
jgi:hypothetical protein